MSSIVMGMHPLQSALIFAICGFPFSPARNQTMNPQITQMNADGGNRDQQTFAVIGAAPAIHVERRPGFIDSAPSSICTHLRHLRIPPFDARHNSYW